MYPLGAAYLCIGSRLFKFTVPVHLLQPHSASLCEKVLQHFTFIRELELTLLFRSLREGVSVGRPY